ncbi:MAG TPA: FAD-binding oxidoreductase [Chloroflexia bacterium]|nr:FAD-binding oxidoreductase [Chloroflexia bacterium]
MIDTDNLIADLLNIGGEDGLSTQPEALAGVAVDGLAPKAILRPANPEQASAFLKYASQRKLKVAIRGGGTRTNLGNPINGLDLVLSTERMNAIFEYSPADLMIGTQAGAKLADIMAELEKNDQFLPIEAAGLENGATIGGAIAANTSGPLRLMYGPARDWLIGVKFILADGTIAKGGGRVVKNVAGFDMMKLFTGSLGTLGLIYEMNFKLMPIPTTISTIIISFGNYQKACEVALKIIDAGLFPAALTVLDRAAAKALGLHEQEATLLVEVRNTARAVERQIRDITVLSKAQGSSEIETVEDRTEQKKLWRAVTDFGYRELPEQSFTLKVSSLADSSAALLDKAHRLGAEHNLEIAAISHAGHGLSWVTGGYDNEAAAQAFIKELTAWSQDNGGATVAERVNLSLKRALGDVWGSALSEGELKLMRALKEKLDPEKTLNPGRFVAGI